MKGERELERGGKKEYLAVIKVGVGCSGGARIINGSSPGMLYLSRSYFHASRKDKSICQVGSKLRRSYRAGYTPLQKEKKRRGLESGTDLNLYHV